MKMIRRLALAAVAATALAAVPSALADGTETLGPPSIAVAQGTNVLVAGAGMQAFPNVDRSFSVNVPAGATIKQVLLYWEGHWTDHAPHFSNVPQVDGDNVVALNGNPVVGTKIGGSTAFFTQSAGAVDGTEKFVAYRADVTALGLVSAGPNTLTIGQMSFASNFPNGFPFDQGNDGAGVLVIYDNGVDSEVIGVRDGLDLAFANFAPPLDATVPQTLTFSAAPSDRPAMLATIAGSVSGPDLGGLRGNVLRVTFDVGPSVTFVDPWQSNQGAEFDASNLAVTVPAGSTSMTVQAFSEGATPASFSWIAASVSIQNPPRNGGAQGCTPGYWKQSHHFFAWTAPYTPTTLLSAVFSPTGLGTLGSDTMLQALSYGGGSTLVAKKQILLRQAVAAVLNAASGSVDYGMTTAQVIAAVNAALESNDATTIENLKNQLDLLNNAGCPLGRA